MKRTIKVTVDRSTWPAGAAAIPRSFPKAQFALRMRCCRQAGAVPQKPTQLAELNMIFLNFPFGAGSFLNTDEQCWTR